MKITRILPILMLIAQLSFSQSIDERVAPTRLPLSEVELIMMPSVDNEALLQAELERRRPGIAPRFAETFEVEISPETHGNWEVLSNGNAVWRLRVLSGNAYSLNLGFSKYIMPRGGTLIVYSPDQKRVMGPFTPADNEEHEELWTPIFDGEQLVIEVQIPAEERHELQLQLKSINHDFIGFSSMAIASGSCNLDVICGAADGWEIVDHYRDIIQSVAVIGLNGSTFCTGFLVNNARQDCTPYFMTANHCGINAGNASSLVAYWNYENSVCRQPNSGASGGPGDGSLADFNTGAIFRSSYAPSDFTLVELDDPVSETADAFFAGWSAVDTVPLDTVIGIHHPSTDEKRISFEFDETEIGSFGAGSNNDHITVPDWDIGTTEGGSSGSPLFNREKQVVGQLHGGLAACGNDEYDSYGWFHISWEGGGTPQSRLKDWLDPDDTGVLAIDGRSFMLCNFFVLSNNPVQSICAPDIAVFNIEVSENFGAPVDLTLTGLPAGLNATFGENPVAPGETTTLTISNTSALGGGHLNINLIGTDGTESANTILQLTVYDGVPTAPSLTMPADGETGLFLTPSFSWSPTTDASSYSFQLATDPTFTDIIAEGTGLGQPTFSGVSLDTETTYYWRVSGTNICGDGEWSTASSFSTGAISCASIGASDLPQTIATDNAEDVISAIEISLPGFVSDVQVVDLNILHSYVGDVKVTLTSPEATTVTLFDRPGQPGSFYGCDGDNLELTFSDMAANTAADLENSCGDLPAISGEFQSLDPLSLFNGELAAGTWILTVSDAVDQDGGSLEAWNLNICVTLPDEVVLIAPSGEFETCESEAMAFDVIVGTGYEGPVTLSSSGLPVGASVEFSENPVAPGSTVEVTVSGALDPASYVLTIDGTDGSNSASTNFEFTVLGNPSAAIPASPANGSADIPSGLTLEWGAVSGAESYTVVVATDQDFNNIFTTNTQTETFYNLSGLNFGTTYFWRVDVLGLCGVTEGVEIYSFTTLPDLTFTVSPTGVTACAAEEAQVSIEVGPGFTAPASISYVVEPGGTPSLSFDVDPNDVMPNSTVGVTIGDLFNLTPGFNSITFTISDGIYEATTTFSIIVETAPALTTLTFPADGSVFPDNPNITFLWNAVTGATSYTIEIATDLNFTNIIESGNTTGTSFNAQNIESAGDGTYFWRVTALNDCGGSTTAPFNFVYDVTSATNELNGRVINISPNPTSGDVQITLSDHAGEDLKVDVFSIDGKQLQQYHFGNSQLSMKLDLHAYPAGVYLVRLTEGRASISQRIILQ